MSTERIDIVVSEKGSKEASANIERIGKSAETSSVAVDFLKGTLIGLAAGFSVGKIIELADAYNTVTARLKGLSTSADEYRASEEALFQVAQRTRSGFDETVNLFGKLKQGTEGLNFSTNDLIGVTETLNQVFTNGGASAEQTKQAMVQLAQGLGSGALRGEELNSVMEATQGEFGRVLRASGVVTGSIKDFAEQGKLTSKVLVEGLQKAAGDVAAKFATVPITVSQASTALANAFERLVGQANQAYGVTALLAQGILLVANNLSLIVNTILPVAAGLGTYYASTILASTGTGLLTTAVRGLTAAIVANPIGALAAIIATAIAALYAFAGSVEVVSGTSVTYGGIIRDTFRLVGASIQFALEIVTSFAQSVVAGFQFIAQIIGSVTGSVVGGFAQWLASVLPVQGAFNLMREFFQWLGDIAGPILDVVAKVFEKLANDLLKAFPALQKIVDILKSFGKDGANAAKSTDSFGSSLSKTSQAAGGAASNMTKYQQSTFKAADDTKLFKTYTDQTTDSLNTLGSTADGAFQHVVTGAQQAASAVDGLRSSVGGLKSGLSDFGSGGQSVNGLSNASSLGGFTITTLPEFSTWLRNFGASPKGNALGLAQTFYSYAQALQQRDTGGQLPQSIVDNYKRKIGIYKQGLGPEEIASLGSMWDSLQKFRDGGSFMVGGDGATDSTLVALRATKGERVTVETPEQQRANRGTSGVQRPVVVNIEVKATDLNSFKRSQDQTLQKFAGALGKAMANA